MNRTIRFTNGFRSTIESSSWTVEDLQAAAALTSVNHRENESFSSSNNNGQWWKFLEEEAGFGSAGNGAAVAAVPWESSSKSDLINFQSLYRVKYSTS